MTIYLDLLKQYNRATGSNCKSVFDKNFKTWLEEYSCELGEYIEFIKKSGYDVKTTNIAELGKGPFDSILVRTHADNIENRLISENATEINIPKRKIKVSKKEIKVLSNGQLLPLDDYDAFMSYNLFSRSQLDRISYLHNAGKDIIYGVFGKKKDIDKRQKLEDVQSIYRKMNDSDFELNYTEDSNSYYYLVSSKSLKLKI